MKEIQFQKPAVHFFICVNDRSSVGNNSCSPGVNVSMVNDLKKWVLSKGYPVFITKTQCLGFCHAEGGVAVVYPSGRFLKEIRNVEDMKEIVMTELKK